MNANCTTENVALVLSIASAKVFQLEQLKHLHDDRQSESYAQLGVDEYPGLTFLMNVAKGNMIGWDVHGSDGIISSKIYPDTQIVKVIAGLASNSSTMISSYGPQLCKTLSIDPTIAISLINIAMGESKKLNSSIETLATRLRCDAQMCLGFCSGSSLEIRFVQDLLGAMCDKLTLNPELAASIMLIAQCKGQVSLSAISTLIEYLEVLDANSENMREKAVLALSLVDKNNQHVITNGKKFDKYLGFDQATKGHKSIEKNSENSLCAILLAIAKDDATSGLDKILNAFEVDRSKHSLVKGVVDIFNRAADEAAINEVSAAVAAVDSSVPSGFLIYTMPC